MESLLPSEVARLVLGYLEENNCTAAYESFLKSSPHLEECLKMQTEGKKFRTQVMGLTLDDILAEYSAIDSLVQEQLKKLEPNVAANLKCSGGLLDKLKVLFDASTATQMMFFSITVPSGKSPQKCIASLVRKRIKSSAERRKEPPAEAANEEVTSCPETSEVEANQTSVETTSLANLPGSFKRSTASTTSVDDNVASRPTKKKCSPQKRTQSDSEVVYDQGDNLTTRVTKAISEVRSPENTSKNCKPVIDNTKNHPTQSKLDANPLNDTNALSVELDNAMKSIVHENTDTAFDNLFGDIIGPVPSEISDEYEERSTNNQSEQETSKVTPAKHRDKPNSLETPTKIDDQNAAAIESIIQMNSLGADHADPKTTKDFVSKTQHIADKTGPSDIPLISVPTGSTASSVPCTLTATTSTVASAATTSSATTQESVITLPSIVFSQASSMPTAPPVPDNRYIFLNNAAQISTPILIHSTQIQMSTQAVGEQDILSMPTLILCENRPTTTFVPQPIYPASSTIKATLPTLIPAPMKNPIIKPTPAVVTAVVASTTTSTTATTSTGKPTSTSFQTTDVPTKIHYKITVQQVDSSCVTSAQTTIPNTTTTVTTTTTTSKTTTTATTTTSTTAGITATAATLAMQSTCGQPSLPTLSESVEKPKTVGKVPEAPTKLLTPRNTRSHIRALDFSTPPKTGALAQKSSVSPKQSRAWRAPKVRNNLFSSPDLPSVPIATRSPMEKLSGDWDGVQGADLIFRGTNIAVESPEQSTSTSAELPNARPRRLAAMHTYPKYQASEQEKNCPKKLKRSWDADLRTLLPTSDECKSPPSKKNKITRKKRKYVKQTKVSQNLNNTEAEGAAIEKELAGLDGPKDVPAIKTPKKKVNRKRKPAQKVRKTTKRKREAVCSEEEDHSDENKVKFMTILSPSKMNANKRTLEVKGNKGAPEKLDIIPEEVSGASTPIEPSFPASTPVNSKQVLSAKRNLTPALETPNKSAPFTVPTTPKCCTPFLQSPFQKIYRENFGSLDICSIPTPSIPVTPNISLTPFGLDCGTFETRPTDYSNSSSYYQPSDTEQNQKLENALIEECMKFENNKFIEKNKVELPLDLTKVSTENEMNSEKIEGICEHHDKEPQDDGSPVKAADQVHLSISNCSSSSNSSTSSDTSSCCSSCNSRCETEPSPEINQTVIHLETPLDFCPYSLRNKSKVTSNAELSTLKPQGAAIALTKSPKCVPKRPKPVSNVKNIHADLLNTLKTKLARTKTELSTVNKKYSERSRGRSANRARGRGAKCHMSRFVKGPEIPAEPIPTDVPATTPIPSPTQTPAHTPAHTPLQTDIPIPIYEREKTPERNEVNEIILSGNLWSDEEIPRLHISSDEEPTSDMEAPPDSNILIKELKERGIHLIPKISLDSKSEKDMNSKDGNVSSDEETLKAKADSDNVNRESNTTQAISNSKSFENSEKDLPSDTKENDDANKSQLDINNFGMNDLEFDTKTFTEDSAEYFHVVHDNRSGCEKSFSDYSLDLLNKAITAKVYLEESNMEQERSLTITPVTYLLDISPTKQKTIKPRRASTTQKLPSTKENFKPLSILYDQLVSDSSSGEERERTKKSKRRTTAATGDLDTDKLVHNSSDILLESSSDESQPTTSVKIARRKRNGHKTNDKARHERTSNDDNFVQSLDTCSDQPGNELAEEQCAVIDRKQLDHKPDADNEKKTLENDKQALLLKYGLDTLLSKVHGPSN